VLAHGDSLSLSFYRGCQAKRGRFVCKWCVFNVCVLVNGFAAGGRDPLVHRGMKTEPDFTKGERGVPLGEMVKTMLKREIQIIESIKQAASGGNDRSGDGRAPRRVWRGRPTEHGRKPGLFPWPAYRTVGGGGVAAGSDRVRRPSPRSRCGRRLDPLSSFPLRMAVTLDVEAAPPSFRASWLSAGGGCLDFFVKAWATRIPFRAAVK
jgi:hypothetical protein